MREGLVGVLWDDDFGVVDLTAKKIVMHGYGDHDTIVSWYIPTLSIENEDFSVLLPEADRDNDDAVDDKATWDNVVALLLHADFLFATYIRPPENTE